MESSRPSVITGDLERWIDIEKGLREREKFGLHEHAAKYEDARRLNAIEGIQEDTAERVEIVQSATEHLRNDYVRDGQRIKYSPFFSRLQDVTQVWTTPGRAETANRLTHSLWVADISRFVCRVLRLNEHLAEAIALGHDLGHPAIAHEGEVLLTAVARNFAEKESFDKGGRMFGEMGAFYHNVQSLRVVDLLAGRSGENLGTGLNLTFQVRNGILAHDGEAHDMEGLTPDSKTDEAKMQDYVDKMRTFVDSGKPAIISPSTLEGCVVRFVDTIAYLGSDFEDAVALDLCKRTHLPVEIMRKMGNTNRQIISALVLDLIINSSVDERIIKYDRGTAELVKLFKKVIAERLYPLSNPWAAGEKGGKKFDILPDSLFGGWNPGKVRDGLEHLFENLLTDMEQRNVESPIYRKFLDRMDINYCRKTPNNAVIVRDFIVSLNRHTFLDEIKASKRTRKRRKKQEKIHK